MRRGDVWVTAWCAVASGWNSKAPDATRYADICLKEFDERFPSPALETQFAGTPLSELSDEERADFRRTLAAVPFRAASGDTHPKDGDVKQAPLVSGAVPHEDAADAQPHPPANQPKLGEV